jgi:hypothetical protein
MLPSGPCKQIYDGALPIRLVVQLALGFLSVHQHHGTTDRAPDVHYAPHQHDPVVVAHESTVYFRCGNNFKIGLGCRHWQVPHAAYDQPVAAATQHLSHQRKTGFFLS